MMAMLMMNLKIMMKNLSVVLEAKLAHKKVRFLLIWSEARLCGVTS